MSTADLEFTPVILLTGFLGSGKTTLLGRLLKDPALGDTAVLINEFGEVGLDHHLIDRIDGDMVLLSSGCVCCTVRGELSEAIKALHGRRERGEIPPFRRIVIESTGLADPLPVIATITADPVLKHHFRMGAVVTTVDAVNGCDQLARQPESVNQAAVADHLVLTKRDIAAPDATEAVVAALRALNPDAPLHDAGERLDAAALLSERTVLSSTTAGFRCAAAPDSLPAVPHGGGIASFSLAFEAPLDWTRFGLWLSMLLNRHGGAILRVKGVLNLEGSETPVAIHGVQHLVHVPTHLEAWLDPEDRRSRLVFITRGLAPDRIRRSMAAFGLMPTRRPLAA